MDAASSSRLLAQAQRPWGVPSEEESRDSLQTRLNAYSKLMFWSFVALLLFLGADYQIYDIKPKNQNVVFGGSAVMLALMAFIWRALLFRKPMSIVSLYRIDILYAIAVGGSFGASAALQFDLPPAAYTSLIFAGYAVFTRALFVPSSAKRTAVVSSITFVPVVLAGVYLGFTTHQDLPPIPYVGGGILLCSVAVLIATNGSAIIYGLRRQVSQAKQLGVYTLGQKIGEGGMGSVYRAHHALLRREAAIKRLLPDRVGVENLDRFEREVQHMSRLTHPNTVAVFDYGRTPDGVFYYAMEYLGGIDLEHLVKLHGPQPAGRVRHIMAQVCGALQEAHLAGLIHRDIKPANIILCERGGVPDFAKVVDFGLVKEIARDSAASTQVILGTPAYVAPEAVTDPDRITASVDLYALGAVGYYLLTGQRVFDGKTSIEMCIQHVTQAATPPSKVTTNRVPPELEAVIMKCLSKDPEARYPSAAALAAALGPQLGAVAPAPDWSLEDAARWWRGFRATEPAPTTTPTVTMTVDLEQRSA